MSACFGRDSGGSCRNVHGSTAVVAGVFAMAAIFLPVQEAGAQSFNCRYAKTPDEVAICQYSHLASLDEQMASIYFSLRRQLGGSARRQLERDQKYWLQGRMRCGYDAGCIEDSYNRRIYQLSYNY